jgi:hypothetical protein
MCGVSAILVSFFFFLSPDSGAPMKLCDLEAAKRQRRQKRERGKKEREAKTMQKTQQEEQRDVNILTIWN